MEINVLGPLEATENGRSIAPTAAKPRQILALLGLHAGEMIPVPMLMEELWGMAPPRSAMTTLQTYILQLRRHINKALAGSGLSSAKDVLITRYNGYQLSISPEQVDAKRYDRLASAGRRAAEIGDHQTASEFFQSALDTWRGDALVDIQIGPRLAFEVAVLEESKLGVTESRIETELRLGRHNLVLGELASLTARSPMNENLCAQFMIALYRAGRQWRALDVFKTLRSALVEELGVEPSERIQRLQRAILNGDPGLDLPAERELTAR